MGIAHWAHANKTLPRMAPLMRAAALTDEAPAALVEPGAQPDACRETSVDIW